jgi:hypothetical protein
VDTLLPVVLSAIELATVCVRRDTTSPLLYTVTIRRSADWQRGDIRRPEHPDHCCSALEGHVSQTKSFVVRAVAGKYTASCRGAVANGRRFTKTSSQPNTEAIQR